jgi:hypothetical protein
MSVMLKKASAVISPEGLLGGAAGSGFATARAQNGFARS